VDAQMGLLRRTQHDHNAGVQHGVIVTLSAEKVLGHQLVAP
jgi:hypothetical protein